jgi:vacuolar-type H+-ATPase subunit H
MVLAAKSEAERVLSEAQKRAQELVVSARQTARVEAEKMLATALQEAEAEKKERLLRTAAEIETQVSITEALMRQTAEAVIRCVCGFHQPTRGMTP